VWTHGSLRWTVREGVGGVGQLGAFERWRLVCPVPVETWTDAELRSSRPRFHSAARLSRQALPLRGCRRRKGPADSPGKSVPSRAIGWVWSICVVGRPQSACIAASSCAAATPAPPPRHLHAIRGGTRARWLESHGSPRPSRDRQRVLTRSTSKRHLPPTSRPDSRPRRPPSARRLARSDSPVHPGPAGYRPSDEGPGQSRRPRRHHCSLDARPGRLASCRGSGIAANARPDHSPGCPGPAADVRV